MSTSCLHAFPLRVQTVVIRIVVLVQTPGRLGRRVDLLFRAEGTQDRGGRGDNVVPGRGGRRVVPVIKRRQPCTGTPLCGPSRVVIFKRSPLSAFLGGGGGGGRSLKNNVWQRVHGRDNDNTTTSRAWQRGDIPARSIKPPIPPILPATCDLWRPRHNKHRKYNYRTLTLFVLRACDVRTISNTGFFLFFFFFFIQRTRTVRHSAVRFVIYLYMLRRQLRTRSDREKSYKSDDTVAGHATPDVLASTERARGPFWPLTVPLCIVLVMSELQL